MSTKFETAVHTANLQALLLRPRMIYKSKPLAKEVRQSFITYFAANYPPVRGLKLKVDSYHRQVVARARFNKRLLYARHWSIEKCFDRFVYEYEQKVLTTTN